MGQLVLDRVKIMPCKRCINGSVIFFKDNRWTCANCGQDHTPDGELIESIAADEFTLERTPARFSAQIYGVKL